MPRSGRRRGDSGSRDAILGAARSGFAAHGYDRATIRGIARAAGVDPALVHHFFGTKAELFTSAMSVPVNPEQLLPAVLAPGTDGLGERLVRFFLTMTTAADSPFAGIVRSAMTHDPSARMLREFVTREILGRLVLAIDADEPELRASLVASQLVGLGMARVIVGIEPLASASDEVVVSAVAPTIQRYLTGPLH